MTTIEHVIAQLVYNGLIALLIALFIVYLIRYGKEDIRQIQRL